MEIEKCITKTISDKNGVEIKAGETIAYIDGQGRSVIATFKGFSGRSMLVMENIITHETYNAQPKAMHDPIHIAFKEV